jgi:hypothetical protein
MASGDTARMTDVGILYMSIDIAAIDVRRDSPS